MNTLTIQEANLIALSEDSTKLFLNLMRSKIDSMDSTDLLVGIHDQYITAAVELGQLEWVKEVLEDLGETERLKILTGR